MRIIALTLLLCLPMALAVSTAYPSWLFHGDFVHPHLLLTDFYAGGTLWDWNNSAAIYAFPDWILAVPALAPISPVIAIFLSSAFILIGSCLAGAYLVKVIRDGVLMSEATIGVALILILSFFLGSFSRLDWLLAYSGSLYIHTGAALVLLLSCALFLQWLRQDFLVTRQGAALIILVPVTVYSDLIFLAWFCAPAFATSVIVSLKTRSIRQILKGMSVVSLGLISMFVESQKSFPSASREILKGSGTDTLFFVASYTMDGFRRADPLIIFYTVTVALACAWGLYAIMRRWREPRMNDGTILVATVTGAIVSLPLSQGLIRDEASFRYLIALVYLAPVVFSQILPRSGVIVGGLFAIPAVVIAALSSAETVQARITQASLSPLIQCLDVNGLSDGFGGYDHAKPITFLSGGRIHVAQTGIHRPTNFSRRLARERLDGSAFEPRFVILGPDISRDMAVQDHGTPDGLLECPSSIEVLIYDATIAY